MRKSIIISLILCCFCSNLASQAQSASQSLSSADIKTEADSTSYLYGMILSIAIAQQLPGNEMSKEKVQQEYNSKTIYADNNQKKLLEDELKHKLDSLTELFTESKTDIVDGFYEAMFSSKNSHAFRLGTMLAGQILENQADVEKDLIGGELNKALIAQGFKDTTTDSPSLIPSVTDPNSYIDNRAYLASEKRASEKRTEWEDNKRKGNEFLAKNKKNKDVIALDNGLQYKIIKLGMGKQPTRDDRVKVHYEGRRIDGTIFDSSYDSGEPQEFGIIGLIAGFAEALSLMSEGSVWEVYIPNDLAYGSTEHSKIPPYSALIFKIELISIED